MPLSILAHTFSNDLRAALDAVRRAEFQGVVLDPTVFGAIVEPSQTGRRELLALLSRYEQPVVAIDLRLGPAGFSPNADIERELDRTARAIEIARGLQTSLLLLDLGPLPPAIDERPPALPITPSQLGKLILPDTTPPKSTAAPLPRDLLFESSIDVALRELGGRADRLGCRIAMRSSLGSFASLHQALSRVDCPWFGVDLDPVLMLADEWSADEILSRLGSLVAHVRARDGVKGAGNRVVSTPLGKGSVDWRSLRAQLRDADYRGPISVDPIDLPHRLAGVEAAKAVLSLID